jgi:hypothetical protein
MPAMSEREMRLAIARGRRAQRRQALRDSTVDAIVAPSKYTHLIAAGIINWESEAVPVRNLLMNGSSSSNGGSTSLSTSVGADPQHQHHHHATQLSSSHHQQPIHQSLLPQDNEYILSLEGAMAIETDLLDAKIVFLDAETLEKNSAMKRLIKLAQVDADAHNKAISDASSSSSSSSTSLVSIPPSSMVSTTAQHHVAAAAASKKSQERGSAQAVTASAPSQSSLTQSGHKRKGPPLSETTTKILPGRSPLRLRMGGLGVPAFSVIETSPYDSTKTKTWRDRYNKGDPKVGSESFLSSTHLKSENTLTTLTIDDGGEECIHGGDTGTQGTTSLRQKRISTKKNFDIYSSSSSSISSSSSGRRKPEATPSWWKEQQVKPWILWPPNGPKRSPPPPRPPPPSIGNLSSESSTTTAVSSSSSSSSFRLTHPYYCSETNDADKDEDESESADIIPSDAPRIGWDYSYFGEQLKLAPLMRLVNEHSYVNGPCLRKAWEGAVAQAALYPHLHQGVGGNSSSSGDFGGKKKKKGGVSLALSSSASSSAKPNNSSNNVQATSKVASSRVDTKPSTQIPKLKLTTRKPAQKPTGPSYTNDDFVWEHAKQISSRSRSSPLKEVNIETTADKSTTIKGKTSSSLMSLGLGGGVKVNNTTGTSQQQPQPRSLRLRGEAVEPPPDPSKLPVELRPTVWATSHRKRDRGVGGGDDTSAHLPSRAGVVLAATRTKRPGSDEPLPPLRQSSSDESSFAYPPPPPEQQQQRRSHSSLFNPVSIWNTSRISPLNSNTGSGPIGPWGSVLPASSRKRSRPSDQALELQKSRKLSLRTRGEEVEEEEEGEEDEGDQDEEEGNDNVGWSVGSVLKTILSGGLR